MNLPQRCTAVPCLHTRACGCIQRDIRAPVRHSAATLFASGLDITGFRFPNGFMPTPLGSWIAVARRGDSTRATLPCFNRERPTYLQFFVTRRACRGI